MSVYLGIIGLGNIGYYLGKQKKDLLLNHYKSFNNNDYFKIIFGVDKNKKTCINFSRETGIKSYNSIKEAIINNKPELIVISTPYVNRLNIFQDIFSIYIPKVILSEKPLDFSYDNILAINSLIKKFNTKLFINYPRNSNPAFINNLKKFISVNSIKNGHVYYKRGVNNNASHFIVLLIKIFNSFPKIMYIEKKRIIKNDFNANFILIFNDKIHINFYYIRNSYIEYELELTSNKYTINYSSINDFIHIKKNKKGNNLYKNKKININKDINQVFVVKELKKFFKNQKYSLCDIEVEIFRSQLSDFLLKYEK